MKIIPQYRVDRLVRGPANSGRGFAPVSAEITMEAAALGHPALGPEKRQLELAKDELGFLVLHNRERSS